ncbi:hypothetical protein EDB19DRAFT_1920485 [Suillus lakei]|nr:hypothetical protein EDB19DRAFT_1920485 [Suillus lakei]
MWRLWADEEATASRRVRKENAALLRQNCGALVAQHMLARLLAVDQLVSLKYDATAGEESVPILDEWKIRWSRDWFNTTYDQAARTGAGFLKADPIKPENRTFFEGDWNVADEGKGLLSPPADTAEWIGGKIEGLEEMFAKSLKNDALAALKKPDYYTQTQYDDQARLPVRWHEGHKPTPCFWSVRMWTWAAKGNCFEDQSMDLLFFILTQTAPKASFQEFSQTLSSLLNIIVDMPPEEEEVRTISRQLWMGEMTWREFVEAMMTDYLAELPNTASRTSEKRDPTNVFNTLEARLILEGYVRRHEAHAPWDIYDNILWQSLQRITTDTYLSVWQWIISEIVLGKKVPQVLNEAGPWWAKAQAIAKKREAQNAEDQQEQADENMHEDDNPEDSGSSRREAEPNSAADKTVKQRQAQDAEEEQEQADEDMREDDNPEGSGFARQEAEPNSAAAKRLRGIAIRRSLSSTPPAPTPGYQTLLELGEARHQYSLFLSHRSIDQYATELNSQYGTSDYGAIIKEHVRSLRAWAETNDPDPPKSIFGAFSNGLKAITARKEAEMVRQDLL